MNALAKMVEEAWDICDFERLFLNVFSRWVKAMALIIAANGDNAFTDLNHKVVSVAIQAPRSLMRSLILKMLPMA